MLSNDTETDNVVHNTLCWHWLKLIPQIKTIFNLFINFILFIYFIELDCHFHFCYVVEISYEHSFWFCALIFSIWTLSLTSSNISVCWILGLRIYHFLPKSIFPYYSVIVNNSLIITVEGWKNSFCQVHSALFSQQFWRIWERNQGFRGQRTLCSHCWGFLQWRRFSKMLFDFVWETKSQFNQLLFFQCQDIFRYFQTVCIKKLGKTYRSTIL